MSNTTIRPIPTLKGMFSVPRATQGRNFLKENKKSLRSLEKATTQKLAAKEPVRPKWMPPLRRTTSEANENEPKRCETERLPASRHHDDEICLLRSHSKSRSQHCLDMPQPEVRPEPRPEPCAPPEPRKPKKEKVVIPKPQPVEEVSSRCQSCGTERVSTSIGIQTEDIMDELYLTNALKKCNIDPDADYDDNYGSYSQFNDDELPLSARSNPTKNDNFDMEDNDIMPLPEMENLALDNTDEEAPLSARSRETIGTVASNATTKSKRREHKLGSRDDLRLPRYLEKEKREKAEAQEILDARDPDCPRGHVLMSEPDRLAALASAKQRFDMLISELNHMPMTAQTLRVRSRKAEIDKELTVVEDEIRIFSKAKAYIRAGKSRNL